ncbi:MAG: hypothetical protein K8S15_05375 [Candidatus Aegiribacteria sp.]|nr:hypothetical protein [Candidatus Aegiribacteria sp.]
MKVFLIVLFSLPVVTNAGSVNVLSSFYSPDWFPNGLAWDGNYLWLLGGHHDTFYKINTGGTVISHFTPSEPGGMNGDGAAFDGTNLWGMFIEHTSYPGEVYEYTTSGTYVSSFMCSEIWQFGMTWDGNNLWVSCRGTQMIYEMSKDGTILSSFPIPHEGVGDMAWNGTNLFYAAKNDKLIVEVTTDGVIIDTYDVTVISSDMKPTALTFDGTDFWVSDQEHDIIYQVELTGVGLEQYTFGRIKTVFQ